MSRGPRQEISLRVRSKGNYVAFASVLGVLSLDGRDPREEARKGARRMLDLPFVADVQELRDRVRRHIKRGSVNGGSPAGRDTVLRILNEALATEITCVLRYTRSAFTASAVHSLAIAEELLEHANEEQAHVDQLTERIMELGGTPNFDPEGLRTRSFADSVVGDSREDMLKEDLAAARIVIDGYRGIIRFLGEQDPASRRMLEGILVRKEEHAAGLLVLLGRLRSSDLSPGLWKQ